MTISELDKELKQNILQGIYLFYGEETYLIETYLKKIKKHFGELLLGINYVQLDNSNLEEIITNLETPPFGYDKKLIIVRDTSIFQKTTKKENQQQRELKVKIFNYFKENINEITRDNIIVFINENIEKNDFYMIIEKNGKICSFERQTLNDLVARLKPIFLAYNVQIEDILLKYLIETCGNNLQILINESRKIIEYAGAGGIIKKEYIDAICIKEVDAVIFDLTDYLGKKEITKALDILKNLLYNKEPIQKILIILYNHFKRLFLVKFVLEENRNILDALDLKPNQEFLARKYKIQSEKFKKEDLKNILNELINIDKNSKQGLIDLNIGIESVLCMYCSI